MKGPKASLCVCVCVCEASKLLLYLPVWLMCWNPAEVNSTFYLLLAATARFPRWEGRTRTGLFSGPHTAINKYGFRPETHPRTNTHTHTQSAGFVRASNYNPSASCSNAPEGWHWENISKPVAHNPKNGSQACRSVLTGEKCFKKMHSTGKKRKELKNAWCKILTFHL